MTRTQNPILAVAGTKGGTGKSTIAVHLASALGTKGAPAVLVDADPQFATSGWLLPTLPPDLNLALDLERARPMRSTPAPLVPTVRVVPGDIELAGWDMTFERTRDTLPAVLKATPDTGPVVVDLPPTWGALLAGTLLTVDAVVVVVEARELGLAGLARLLDLVDQASEQNPNLALLGIIPSKVGRTRLARDVVARLRERYRIVLPPVREAACIAELPGRGVTLWETSIDHGVRNDMTALVRAVRRKLKGAK